MSARGLPRETGRSRKEPVRRPKAPGPAFAETGQTGLRQLDFDVHAGSKIELRGFGSFKLRQRGARIARNPKRSGVKVHVPPKLVPYFKPGKKLKELINAAAPEPDAAPDARAPEE